MCVNTLYVFTRHLKVQIWFWSTTWYILILYRETLNVITWKSYDNMEIANHLSTQQHAAVNAATNGETPPVKFTVKHTSCRVHNVITYGYHLFVFIHWINVIDSVSISIDFDKFWLDAFEYCFLDRFKINVLFGEVQSLAIIGAIQEKNLIVPKSYKLFNKSH